MKARSEGGSKNRAAKSITGAIGGKETRRWVQDRTSIHILRGDINRFTKRLWCTHSNQAPL
jgi:hypothetical protein